MNSRQLLSFKKIRVVDPDPDPGARKLRNFSGKKHFLVILKKNFTTEKV
jgi:hypothetical protein